MKSTGLWDFSMVVSHHVGLGIEPRSSERAASAFNYWTIATTLVYNILNCVLHKISIAFWGEGGVCGILFSLFLYLNILGPVL